jgi:hypothetical protein
MQYLKAVERLQHHPHSLLIEELGESLSQVWINGSMFQ